MKLIETVGELPRIYFLFISVYSVPTIFSLFPIHFTGNRYPTVRWIEHGKRNKSQNKRMSGWRTQETPTVVIRVCAVANKGKKKKKSLRRIIFFISFSRLFNRINIKWRDNTGADEKKISTSNWGMSSSRSLSFNSSVCRFFGKCCSDDNHSTTWNTVCQFRSNGIGWEPSVHVPSVERRVH